MDFQFTYYLGNIFAKCSMGHEAVANWLNTEVRLNPEIISTALSYLKQASRLSPSDKLQLIGKEYSLFINRDEVIIKANNLALSDDNLLEENFNYYDEESIAFCGLEDFSQFLQSYLSFKQAK
ncbi:hypothetical protein A6A11_06010 [Bisgaardia hudsonensis]|nr:YacL family protein [Bisgaardia hudsonensis]QLB13197.1 hypothetical protein A6A11_06010 [Bisgaardia hudsonensis]